MSHETAPSSENAANENSDGGLRANRSYMNEGVLVRLAGMEEAAEIMGEEHMHHPGMTASAHSEVILMAHSNDPTQVQCFTIEEWEAFILGVRAGEFDLADGQMPPITQDQQTETQYNV